jgi:hypothetical protein
VFLSFNIQPHLSPPLLLYFFSCSSFSLQFHEHGYLFLSSESGLDTLKHCNTIQTECGVTGMDMLPPSGLKKTFPWLSTEGLVMGSYGTVNEGYFDPWSLLAAMKKKVLASFATIHPCTHYIYIKFTPLYITPLYI